MGTSLDGIILFGDTDSQVEVGSFTRESIDRSATGLDGVVSIDFGERGRKIKQKGELRARSTEELNKKVEAMQAFMDGNTHTLAGLQGQVFENIRIDSVSVRNERASGGGVVADYEIVYMQLMV
jgi:hypothetical protein